MKWNWQQEHWPEFQWDSEILSEFEDRFLRQSGMFQGTLKHTGDDDRERLTIDLLSTEAVGTSEIEGEVLDRDSVQSSIRRSFGLDTDGRRVPPAEQGIAEMMFDVFRGFDRPLSHSTLFAWYGMLTSGRRDLSDIGRYRTQEDAMQVVSGAMHEPDVHFEAPPSREMDAEMSRFIDWFNESAPNARTPLPGLTRAGIAHLYFVCIHPFEDGNGRIGRGVSQMALSQSLGQPTLLALSHTILADRRAYYRQLKLSNKGLEITGWLQYFAQIVLDAQVYSQRLVDFLIAKIRFYDRLRDQLNERQHKVVARMFREGLEGFKGGLSAENYLRITGTSRATATRDLQDLVEKGAFLRSGERRHTRYWLNV